MTQMAYSDLEAAEANIHHGIFKDEDAHTPTHVTKQQQFKQTVLAAQSIVVNKLYKQKSHSLENYFKTVWKISRAQVYRFLDCAHVLSVLQRYPVQPSHERLCRSLKRVAKTDEEVLALWDACLAKVGVDQFTTDEDLITHAYDTITSSFVNKVHEDLRQKKGKEFDMQMTFGQDPARTMETTPDTAHESESEHETSRPASRASRKKPMVINSPAWKTSSLSSSLDKTIDVPLRPSSAGDWKRQLRELEYMVGVDRFASLSPPALRPNRRKKEESGYYSSHDEANWDLTSQGYSPVISHIPSTLPPTMYPSTSTHSINSEDYHPYHGGLTHFAHHHVRDHAHLYQPYGRESPRMSSPLAHQPGYDYYQTYQHYYPPLASPKMEWDHLQTQPYLATSPTPHLQAPKPHRPQGHVSSLSRDSHDSWEPIRPSSAQPVRPGSALDDLVKVALGEISLNEK